MIIMMRKIENNNFDELKVFIDKHKINNLRH